jgi:hypothetical protein
MAMNRWRHTGRIASLARRLGIGHNPLRRNIDRVEIALLWAAVGLAVVALPFALLAGSAADHHSLGVSAAQTAARQQVTALLIEPAPLTVAEYGAIGGPLVPARWSGPNGVVHTGLVTAAPGDPAGTPLRIWNDSAGDLVAAPVTTAQADARGMLAAVGVMFGVVAVLGALFGFAHTRLERVRAKAWTAQWRQVGPRWTIHAN